MHRYKSAEADLYHIEFERSENISSFPQGKYIEQGIARHIDKERPTKKP